MPVPIVWQHDPALAGRKAAASARTSHRHPLALASAAWFGELLAPWWDGASDWDADGEVRAIAQGRWRQAPIEASGHALSSLTPIGSPH